MSMNSTRSFCLITMLTASLIVGCAPSPAGSLAEDEPQRLGVTPTATDTPKPTDTPLPAATAETFPTAQSGDVTASLDWLYLDAQRSIMQVTIHWPEDLTDDQVKNLWVD